MTCVTGINMNLKTFPASLKNIFANLCETTSKPLPALHSQALKLGPCLEASLRNHKIVQKLLQAIQRILNYWSRKKGDNDQNMLAVYTTVTGEAHIFWQHKH